MKSAGIVMLFFIGCSWQETSTQTPKVPIPTLTNGPYRWTKLLDNAEWDKSYNFQMFNHRDTLWTLHPRGAWWSLNGMHWNKSLLPNAIQNLAFLDYISFQQDMFGLGVFNGNIEQYSFRPEIRKSTDMHSWKLLSRSSNLPERFFYHPFVFKNQMWIIGGEDKQTAYADLWNSLDGIHWVQQKNNLPFGKRSNSQIVNLNNQLYLLNNDVWRSTDGFNWHLIAPEIVPGEEIFGYTAVVFDGKIWLLGCNRNGRFTSEVLYSADGKNWTAQEAPWLPRGGVAAAVYQQKIYLTGGKYGGTPDHPEFRYDNDVWVMEKLAR